MCYNFYLSSLGSIFIYANIVIVNRVRGFVDTDSSDSSGASYGIRSTTNTIMSTARLLEILRERERDHLTRRRQKVKGDMICVFCRNNGESDAVYSKYQLKDAQGRVTYPVLYIYTCR